MEDGKAIPLHAKRVVSLPRNNDDDASTVTLEENGLVRKLVLRPKSSGLNPRVIPERLVDREIRALKLLDGVEGIQQFILRDSDISFFSRYECGIPLKEYNLNLPNSYFDELFQILRSIHKRGVYNLDGSRGNFLVTSTQRPILLDFANILFRDDPIANIPGVIKMAEAYSLLRTYRLRSMYTNGNQPFLATNHKP